MFLNLFVLLAALCISGVAAFYSIIGLTAIFSGSFLPIVIMGSVLEVGKIAAALWIHHYWKQVSFAFKMYFIPAIVILMMITSMGIFGYLSKAHLQHQAPVGDYTTAMQFIDSQINLQEDNIQAAQTELKQLNDEIDRYTALGYVTRGVKARQEQAPEREKIAATLTTAQNKILALRKEKADIQTKVNKVVADVGPVRYIAALIYGDNPSQNLLERAVRYVIIMLIFVFDPLAIVLILSASKGFIWEGGRDPLATQVKSAKIDPKSAPYEPEIKTQEPTITVQTEPEVKKKNLK